MKDRTRLLFLEELTKLSRKYMIRIGGCGCCSSPYLDDIEEKDRDGKYIDSDGDDVTWTKISLDPVKPLGS